MTRRTLARRLERLETRLLPAGSGVTEHTIVFVAADGTKTDSIVLKFSGAAPDRNQQREPWRRARKNAR
jgi:hypothetical protein